MMNAYVGVTTGTASYMYHESHTKNATSGGNTGKSLFYACEKMLIIKRSLPRYF